jgi:DNA-directed RNA polymerase subunit RPC12/RpoP
MKFLCLDCDEAMKLHSSAGPDEGSLTVTFRCPECGFRVAMLTNPFETQMVKSLGVKVGGASAPATPFQHITSSMAGGRADAFEGNVPSSLESTGRGCPFGAMINETAGETGTTITWTPEAAARVANIPSFIRPMAKKAIERFAEAQGYPTVTEAVMDEARTAIGM